MDGTGSSVDDVSASEWRSALIAAVKQTAARSSSTKDTRELWGKAEPAPERGAGWYRLFGALADKHLDRMHDAVLQVPGDVSGRQFAVLDVLLEEGSAYVRAQPVENPVEMSLYLSRMDRRRRLERLAEGLAHAAPDHPAFQCFATGRLNPIVRQPDGLSPFSAKEEEQRQAFDACLSPGLQVVWGPPGTGKTQVIVAALNHLSAIGRRCLLISTTNVAVDNALVRLLDSRPSAAGSVVRVGVPSLPELRGRSDVLFSELVKSALEVARQPVAILEMRLAEAEETGAERKLIEARGLLRNFDQATYWAAKERLRGASALLDAGRQLQAEQQRLLDLQGRLPELNRDAAVHQYLVSVLKERGAVQLEEQLRDERDALPPERRFKRFSIDRARQAAFEEAYRAFKERCQRVDYVQSLGAALLPDPNSNTTLEDEIAAASLAAAELRGHDKLLRAQEEVVLLAANTCDQLATLPRPQAADQRIISTAEDQKCLELVTLLPQLEKQAADERPIIASLRDALTKAQRDFEEKRSKVEQEVLRKAQVVATTLTQLVLRPTLSFEAYDVVLVDEAAAATLPEVVLATVQAQQGATLLGDHLQNGPIVDSDTVSRYWRTEVFEQFKLTSPVSAQSIQGCSVLTGQRRFGPAVADLVNGFAYQGMLTTIGQHTSEVVVVDVDGLPETLSHIHREPKKRAGTWAVGALLARALAEHHRNLGETVGVVVPFKGQKSATEATLLDSPVTSGVEVGTAHSFQGREFDTVIFDMVEDGRGWIAVADINGGDFARDGARLANVAMTRARRRVYVLVNARALAAQAKAQARTPLAVLAKMVKNQQVNYLVASTVLELEAVPSNATTGVRDFWLALAPYARVEGLYDEVTLPARLIQMIAGAKHDVWLWSAWVGTFTQDLQDALASASAKGVAVTVMVRPPEEVTTQLAGNIAELRRRTPVIFVEHMHQKLAIIDNRAVFIGSMNVLSAARRPAGRSRERSLEAYSPPLARQILEKEKAFAYRHPPICPICQVHFYQIKLKTRGDDRRQFWACQSPDCSGSREV